MPISIGDKEYIDSKLNSIFNGNKLSIHKEKIQEKKEYLKHIPLGIMSIIYLFIWLWIFKYVLMEINENKKIIYNIYNEW